MKSVPEQMLDAEMDVHLKRRSPPGVEATTVETLSGEVNAIALAQSGKKSPNRCDGHSRKTVKGELTIGAPRASVQ